MIISWNSDSDIVIREKAIGIKIKHNGDIKIMWLPLSQISDDYKRTYQEKRLLEIPDWLYDKKIEELFL